jgi:glycine/D-amino acid oxidase-like deaminating enzyme
MSEHDAHAFEAPVWLSRDRTSADLPAQADVVIVGGGIAGTALAYGLAKAGTEVVLLDRADLNREASGTNAGSFHIQLAIHQLPATGSAAADTERLLTEARLNLEAYELWHTLHEELRADLGVHITGGWMVAETAEQLQVLHDKRLLEAQAGIQTEVVVGDELRERAPYLAPDLAGAAWCAQEGHANPLIAAPLYALRAAEHGAVIRTHAAVTGVDHDPDGGARRFAVHTSAGTLHAHRVVNAAGAWAGELGRMVGLRLPVRREGLHVNVTEPRARVLEPMVQHIGRRLTLKQSSNDTFIIGGGWPTPAAPPPRRYPTAWESAAGNTAVALRVMPLLADVRVVRTWSGVIVFTDDLSPVVGESRRVPGFHACIASTGFTLSPLLARQLADRMVAPAEHAPFPDDYAVDRAAARTAAPSSPRTP